MKVRLKDIIDAMQINSESTDSFLNLRTGEIETLFEDMDEEEQEEISEQLDEDGFIRLPTQYEINAYSIKEQFIEP